MRQSLPKRPTNMRGTGCEQCSSEQGAPCRLHQEAGEERTDKGAEAQAVRGLRPSCQAPGKAPHVSKTPPALSSSPLPAPPRARLIHAPAFAQAFPLPGMHFYLLSPSPPGKLLLSLQVSAQTHVFCEASLPLPGTSLSTAAFSVPPKHLGHPSISPHHAIL